MVVSSNLLFRVQICLGLEAWVWGKAPGGFLGPHGLFLRALEELVRVLHRAPKTAARCRGHEPGQT